MTVKPKLVSRLISFEDLESIEFNVHQKGHRFDYSHPSWVAAWRKAYVPSSSWSGSIGMVALFRGKSCFGGIGLGLQSIRGFPVAALGGYYWPYRTVCSLMNMDEWSEACETLIPALSDVIPARALRLGPVSSEDSFVGLIVDRLRIDGWTLLRRKLGFSYCLNLPPKFEQFSAAASSSVIKNAAYQTRRLSKLNENLRVRRFLLSEMSSENFDELSRIESCSWVAGANGDLKFSSVSDREFWRSLSSRPISEQRVVFWMLYLGDEPLAYSAHLESFDCVYIFANGYVERFSQYSLGAVLSSYIFKDLIERGVKFVDWGMGDSGYKRRWGAQPSVQVFDYLLIKPGWLGFVLRFLPKRSFGGWEVLGLERRQM